MGLLSVRTNMGGAADAEELLLVDVMVVETEVDEVDNVDDAIATSCAKSFWGSIPQRKSVELSHTRCFASASSTGGPVNKALVACPANHITDFNRSWIHAIMCTLTMPDMKTR